MPWRAIALQACRVGLFAALVFLIRDQHVRYQAGQAARDAAQVSVEQLRKVFPTAATLTEWDLGRGARDVLDAQGNRLGYFVQTSPKSDRIVGYSGPTNVLIAFGPDDRIHGLQILSSRDTVEHVGDVLRSPSFLQSFDELSWDEAANHSEVDAVSGATLTSLAIIESVNHRLGGGRPSLRFPQEIALTEVQEFFPEAASLAPRPDQPAVINALDGAGHVVGSVFRTSPAADDVMGYQGPTDTLVAIGPDGRTKGIELRNSYDNQPYVGYVSGDYTFSPFFEELTIEELARLDPEEAEIEGVSGATMTSMAIAHALPKAAQAAITPPPAPKRQQFVIAARDIGTITIVALALLMAFTRLRGYHWLRLAFQLVLIVYLGFLNGDLLSQALLAGWSQSGVPWRLAPGLAILSLAALTIPVVSKRQIYCHHICPFGAAQQLVKQRLPWSWHPPAWLVAALAWIPFLLLGLVVWVAMTHAPVNLAGIEPFDAFIFWIAGVATITIALVGLVASMFVPMAYCRFGCPTGAMLGFLRFHGKADRVGRRDIAAFSLLVMALVIRFS